MKKIIFISTILLFYYSTIISQATNEDDIEYYICLNSVTFSGTPTSNFIPIRKDIISSNYGANQYLQDNSNTDCSNQVQPTIINSYPVAYVSGTKPRVKAIFKTDCRKKLYVKGIGPALKNGQIEFPVQYLEPYEGEIIYPFKNSLDPFASEKVKYWEDFIITWQVSEDNITWVDAGKSHNPLYVTYKAPEPANPTMGYRHFHTLLKVGCEAANGKNSDEDIIDDIWNKLTTLNVKRADDGEKLFYYKEWNCTNTTTEKLIQNADGQCSSWGRFLSTY